MHAASLVSFLAIAGTALAGTFTEHVSFDGPNPFNVGLSLYLPNQVKDNAPLVVAPHPCGGSASQAYNSYGLQRVADQYGFPVIYPDTPHSNHCWDVTGADTQKHNAGGDSQGIVSMTKYIAKKYKSDTSRIFVTGFSSGGMMTELLSAVYPDVYAAGVAFSGVAYGCCTSTNNEAAQMCPTCADGYVTHTGAEWAQIVKNAYPGYSGYRPHMAICHGTVDQVINYHSLGEAIKEWTSVLGVSATPISVQQNTPNQGWTKSVYGNHDEVEGYSAAGVGHGMFDVPLVTKFFDLSCAPGGSSCFRRTDSPAPTSGPTSGPTTAPTVAPTVAPTSAPGNGAKRWGQCGGNNWTGATTCSEGTCVKLNDWYYQCQ